MLLLIYAIFFLMLSIKFSMHRWDFVIVVVVVVVVSRLSLFLAVMEPVIVLDLLQMIRSSLQITNHVRSFLFSFSLSRLSIILVSIIVIFQ